MIRHITNQAFRKLIHKQEGTIIGSDECWVSRYALYLKRKDRVTVITSIPYLMIFANPRLRKAAMNCLPQYHVKYPAISGCQRVPWSRFQKVLDIAISLT